MTTVSALSAYTTPDNVNYRHEPIDVSCETVIKFNVKACHDAHLQLRKIPGDTTSDTYEVVLHGWEENPSSAIREQGMIKANFSGAILSCNEGKPFWVSWANGIVEVGKGHVYAEDRFMVWEDPTPHDVNAVNFVTGWGATGTWELVGVDLPSKLTASECDNKVQTTEESTLSNYVTTSSSKLTIPDEVTTASTNPPITQYDVTTASTNQPTKPYDVSTASTNRRTAQYNMTTASTNRRTSPFDATTASTNGRNTQYNMTTASTNRRTTQYSMTTASTNRRTTQYSMTTASTNRRTTPFDVTTASTNRRTTPFDVIRASTSLPTSPNDVTTVSNKIQTTLNNMAERANNPPITRHSINSRNPIFLKELVDDELEAEIYEPIKRKEQEPEEAEYAALIGIPPFVILVIVIGFIVVSDSRILWKDLRKGFRNVRSTVYFFIGRNH
ncbi:unnamed protein product [Owenia fusiformis]|uniref:Farnesoic acid O-methyl transferase domain-containing protein n=1 Tax=Owenia fusiformis TaxID=6347 RepID=A0A8S4NI52_OWEFU|nr:unnamed protein product [Owenia fusiformis]